MSASDWIDRIVFALVRHRIRHGGSSFENNLLRMIERDFERLSYARLKRLGFAPVTVLDIGAHMGKWSRDFRNIFPDCRVIMVDALEEMEPQLSRTCHDIGNSTYHISLLSSKPQEKVNFYVLPPGSQSGSSMKPERSNITGSVNEMPSVTLDGLMQRELPVKTPLFIKIDVQGAELEVLGGGADTLAMAEWVQLETALLGYNEGAPDMREVIGFMAEAGLHPTEITGFARPGNHLVQIDILFAREGSVLRPTRFSY